MASQWKDDVRRVLRDFAESHVVPLGSDAFVAKARSNSLDALRGKLMQGSEILQIGFGKTARDALKDASPNSLENNGMQPLQQAVELLGKRGEVARDSGLKLREVKLTRFINFSLQLQGVRFWVMGILWKVIRMCKEPLDGIFFPATKTNVWVLPFPYRGS